ncbi:hypothetical protein [Actinomadura fibrosa]|uniref:Uncharacterized protein n=1 Tax=Actinomadura fibrosa TaxID=111802 RepID=A0ABW2XSV6_9ACTN|nr:hypothetical protein [Actinomadura fibrosa]
MSESDLRSVAEELCAAVIEHARLCTETPDDAPRIMPVVSNIHRLIRSYGDTLIEKSGWSNPLLNVEEPTTGPEDEQAGDRADSPPGERTWVSIVDSHAMYVDDPKALIGYAEARTGSKIGNAAEALLLLCKTDGWKPDSYTDGAIEVDWRSTDACTG